MYKIIVDKIINREGFTLDKNGVTISYNSGYMVGGVSACYKIDVDTLAVDLKHFVRSLKAYLFEFDNLYIGGWYDNGVYYLEVSELIKDIDVALSLAKDRGELAIYDIAKGESIYL